MRRRALVCTLAVLVTAATMSAFQALGSTPRIKGASHEHPEDSNYSYICGKAAGNPGVTYKMQLRGPSNDGALDKFEMPEDGDKKIAFKITVAGDYVLKLKRRTNLLDKEQYTVPPPDGPQVGPFSCVRN